MTTGMSVSTFVDAFRDSLSTLAALGVQALPDEMCAHFFLYKLPFELRRDVRAQLAGGKLSLAVVIAKAMSVGAESARPPARVNRAKEYKKKQPLKCFNCGEEGHKSTDCKSEKKGGKQSKPGSSSRVN